MRTNPYYLFSVISFGAAASATLLLAQFVHPLAAWLVAVNVVALCVFRYDKAIAARTGTRVPERVLLLLHALGGAVGAATAMWVMRPRHKTRSIGFRVWFFLLLIPQSAVIGWLSLHT